ncbi:pentapeptide repeat-containing protein [Streptomyces sp. NPDC006992]|uniref:pentapeptide repeat-containing protein n=1 Tax=Streptomyces sp. NPDC006992 TaxID=3155601 RepID=UPI00340E0077
MSRQSRPPEGRGGLRLWPVGSVLALIFLASVVVAAAVFLTGWDLLGARGIERERQLTSKTVFELVKLSFGVVAGSGALVALVVAYRRQRVDEDDARREATRLHTERFTGAVGQLGEEPAAVRLGGVHALVGLADDAPNRAQRQTCIDVLCAYLRLPYPPEEDPERTEVGGSPRHVGLHEVRRTVVRLIRDRLRLPTDHPHSWQGYDFDFTGAVLDGGSLDHAHFSGGSVSFEGAVFRGSVVLNGARFCGGTVNFTGVRFAGGTTNFNGAHFSGGRVSFEDARFCGGTVGFGAALFTGGTVSFKGAHFADGAVSFRGAHFSGNPGSFRGTVSFHGARFCGAAVDFDRARFAGSAVDVGSADFSAGAVTFTGARFADGSADFTRATFSGGAVGFGQAQGEAPAGLVPSDGGTAPAGVSLPGSWHSARTRS